MPDRFFPRRFPAREVWGLSVLHAVLMIAFLAVLVLLAIWLIANIRRAHPESRMLPPASPMPPAPPMPQALQDPAVREARMRYARGEISSEEFLKITTDLGGAPPSAGS